MIGSQEKEYLSLGGIKIIFSNNLDSHHLPDGPSVGTSKEYRKQSFWWKGEKNLKQETRESS